MPATRSRLDTAADARAESAQMQGFGCSVEGVLARICSASRLSPQTPFSMFLIRASFLAGSRWASAFQHPTHPSLATQLDWPRPLPPVLSAWFLRLVCSSVSICPFRPLRPLRPRRPYHSPWLTFCTAALVLTALRRCSRPGWQQFGGRACSSRIRRSAASSCVRHV